MPYGLDMSKYPSRMGKPWNKVEDTDLLKEIKEGVTIKAIAEKHQRTEGGIISHLKMIAVKSYIVDKEPVEIISKETGLTAEEIMFEVRKKESVPAPKKKAKPVGSQITLLDVMRELREMRRILDSLYTQS